MTFFPQLLEMPFRSESGMQLLTNNKVHSHPLPPDLATRESSLLRNPCPQRGNLLPSETSAICFLFLALKELALKHWEPVLESVCSKLISPQKVNHTQWPGRRKSPSKKRSLKQEIKAESYQGDNCFPYLTNRPFEFPSNCCQFLLKARVCLVPYWKKSYSHY